METVAYAAIGFCFSWLVYKVSELSRRVQSLEKANLAERLHKIEWKLYEGKFPI